MGHRNSRPAAGPGSPPGREQAEPGAAEAVRTLERCILEVGPCPGPGPGGETARGCPIGRWLRWLCGFLAAKREDPPAPPYRSEVKAGAVLYAPRAEPEPGSGGGDADGRRWVVVCLGPGAGPGMDPHPAVARALERGACVLVPGTEPGSASLAACLEFARAKSPDSRLPTAVVGVSEGAVRACMVQARGARVAAVANPFDAGGDRDSCIASLARAKSPTLLVNLLGDPAVTRELVGAAEEAARRDRSLVSCVTVPAGRAHPAARDWAYRLALEFCLGE